MEIAADMDQITILAAAIADINIKKFSAVLSSKTSFIILGNCVPV